ncbi:MAG: asparagine--tRNA ligase [bacterium]|nr:asparagine--tRNA ligase [bacterium]
MKHTDIKIIYQNCTSFFEKFVVVCGWVKTSRDSKNVGFVEINDGTYIKNLQVVIDKESFPELKTSLVFPVGTGVMVSGKLVKSEKNICELLLEKYSILGESPSDYPLQKKRHTLEFLRTMPHLRVRANTLAYVQKVRSALAYSSHLYFQSNGYTYVHTPLITGSDAEGAGEVFRVTTLPWDAKAKSEKEFFEKDFFGKPAFLTVSGQLEGETAAMALGKIYTFGPVFRAENSNTSRHVSEFWQCEPEVAFAELSDIIEIIEEYIKFITNYVLKNCSEEIDFFTKFFEPGLREKLELVANSKFVVIEYTEAIEMLKKAKDVNFVYEPKWGDELQSEHERYITEKIFKKPVFVINYPKESKAFYMKQNADGKTVAATDLLVPGVGEIVGCSERETDYKKLVEAMKARGMNPELYKQYLDLRKYGSVPHSGFGIGFDRYVMYCTGMTNIRDVLLYPRAPKELQ